MLVVPTCYLGSIAYYASVMKDDNIIEVNDNFERQSYRSRCDILGANGKITLSIPIMRSQKGRLITKDAQIEYEMPWQKQHWRSITSAYRSSPFFDEYEELFAPIYECKERFLVDFNNKLDESIKQAIEIRSKSQLSDYYISKEEAQESNYEFLTSLLSSKKGVKKGIFDPYYQVFSDKLPFEENLSIIDYIFCEGGYSFKSYCTEFSL